METGEIAQSVERLSKCEDLSANRRTYIKSQA